MLGEVVPDESRIQQLCQVHGMVTYDGVFILVAMTLYEAGVVMGLENNSISPTKFLLAITGRDHLGNDECSTRNVLKNKMDNAEIPPGFFRIKQYFGPNDGYDNETLKKVVMLADEHARNFRESLVSNQDVGDAVGNVAVGNVGGRGAAPEEDERKPAAAAVGRGRDQGGRDTGGRRRGRGGRSLGSNENDYEPSEEESSEVNSEQLCFLTRPSRNSFDNSRNHELSSLSY